MTCAKENTSASTAVQSVKEVITAKKATSDALHLSTPPIDLQPAVVGKAVREFQSLADQRRKEIGTVDLAADQSDRQCYGGEI